MDLRRTLSHWAAASERFTPANPNTLAAATLSAGALALGTLGVLAWRRSRAPKSVYRSGTGGCTPDLEEFPDALLLVREADGTHVGLATALLREEFLPPNRTEDPQDPDHTHIEPLTLDYDEALRSSVEVAMHLALNLAEAEVDPECACGDEDCTDSDIDAGLLALLAGRKMTEFALSFEKFASEHSFECRKCAAEGREAPAWLRARFCRDLADDLLTNFDEEDITVRGVPIAATRDVINVMVDVIAQVLDIPVADQINQLSAGAAQSIAHKEGHDVPKA